VRILGQEVIEGAGIILAVLLFREEGSFKGGDNLVLF